MYVETNSIIYYEFTKRQQLCYLSSSFIWLQSQWSCVWPVWHNDTGVQFQSTCNLCREKMLSNKIFVIFYQPHSTLRKSDAMLYAPSVDEIKNNCENMSLKCYMLELIMVLDEEEIEDQATKCIISFNEFLQPPNDGCPACETYSLKNTSTFLDRLKTLLEKMNAQRNM
uniref:Interleukin n=1 Tax=Anabas testudineus TaxID=64144 RepID=A0AAQ6ILG0_ANATE